MPRRLLALVACLGLIVPPSALAWGRVGHHVASRITEARLTPAARAAVAALLEPGETILVASTWADEHRREIPESAPWHYVNVPITEPRYDPKFAAPGGCVVMKIDELKVYLADTSKPRADRQRALRFLIHFLQDMHQPVHVGDRRDRGGNDLQLRFFDDGKNPRPGTNLHRLWDSDVIERYSTDENVWIKDVEALATPENAALWAKGTTEDWANESLAAAKLAYKPPGTDVELKAGQKLDQPYLDFALPIARERLARAGTRTASVLNDLFR